MENSPKNEKKYTKKSENTTKTSELEMVDLTKKLKDSDNSEIEEKK